MLGTKQPVKGSVRPAPIYNTGGAQGLAPTLLRSGLTLYRVVGIIRAGRELMPQAAAAPESQQETAASEEGPANGWQPIGGEDRKQQPHGKWLSRN